jgi:hypothetical protein
MPNNDLFSGIPALGDDTALENLLNQRALEGMGITQTPAQPALTQPVQTPAPVQEPAQEPVNNQPGQGVTYTSEQIAQILERNRQLEQQLGASQPTAQRQPQQQQPQGYNDRQIAIINALMQRGMTIDQINAYLNRRQNSASSQLAQRVQMMEQYLQRQEYAQAEQAFETKMLTFGDKFGLTEDDLVRFGETALANGINLANVPDVEPIFRALYPEQYSLRMQRMSNQNTSQLYGGSNMGEQPRLAVAKIEDQYVDNFLAKSMPNLYNQFNKK